MLSEKQTISEMVMQQIAFESNLSETDFFAETNLMTICLTSVFSP